MDQSFDISNLIVRAIKGELTTEEQEQLNRWIGEHPDNQALYDKLLSDEVLLERVDGYQLFHAAASYKQVMARAGEAKVVSMKPARYFRYAASWLIPLMITAGLIYFFLTRTPADPLAGIDEQIVPGVEQATLTLADGSTVKLEETQSTNQVQQGKATITKQESGIVYSAKAEESNMQELIYNVLTTPFGGRYSVVLSDGTRVTLNAGSRLKYPVTFDDTIRQVYLAGEAFFDVTTTGTPFIVSSASQNIRVLGTQFNVSAYTNEALITTTLVEGKVQVTHHNDRIILNPGKQSIAHKSERTLSMQAVNTALYTSWVDGKFEFNKDNMDVVIKRLSRWYNFTYEFENKQAVDYHFTGRVDSSQPVSSILEMLEATSDIRFEFTGDRQIVIK